MAFVKIESGVVTQKQPYAEEGFIEASDSVVCGYVYSGGVFSPPVPNNAALLVLLKEYRNTVIAQPITVGGVQVMNDKSTMDAINDAINAMLVLNTSDATLDWKAMNGFFTVTAGDLQGLLKAGFIVQQKAFTAERAVLTTNATTPYTTWAAMKAAFDALMV